MATSCSQASNEELRSPTLRISDFPRHQRNESSGESPVTPACLGDFSPSLSLQLPLCGRFRDGCSPSRLEEESCPLWLWSSPFSRGQSRPLCSFTPFLAFLKRTDVRLPTPLSEGLAEVPMAWRANPFRPLSLSKRWKAWLSLCSVFLSKSSPSDFSRLCSLFKDLLSLMGLRVGGSCRESSSDREGAGPVGSRVGGSGGLVSSAKEKKNLLEHFRKYSLKVRTTAFCCFLWTKVRRGSAQY